VNWEAIGAIGEIVGAVAVVLSLIYLAAQIRQNTQQVEEQCRTQRQNSLLGARSSFTEWRSLVIQDPTIAAIWRKANRGLEQLAEDERTQVDFLLVDFFWAHATIWIQMEQGLVDEPLWVISRSNVAIYAGPGVRAWWSTSPHRGEYPQGFVESIDDLLETPIR
jgi:hypothetical protein